MFYPGMTLVTLIYLFSIFLVVGGIVNMMLGIFSIGKGTKWFLTLILGFLQLGVGVYLIRHIGVSIATFILLAGFMLIVRGVLHIVAAFMDEEVASNKTMAIIGGGLAILAGVALLLQPTTSLAFVWILGLYALVAGPFMIAGAFEVKALAKKK
jgi:uncharacterized membrane protein HdeD (DUF308 family)